MLGKVFLIGMGPGDFDLVSLKAVKAINRCDILIYDRLVNKEFLRLNSHAELIYVGKEAGNHTMKQEDINSLLIQKAKEGLVVGRLKGGDPFVFGRGGEEALELNKHRIECEVIPGITSAISVPMYAGIPVTHRGVATSFHVITGHENTNDNKADYEWEALARLKGTLVFLMGVENLDMIIRNLIKHNKNPQTPVAVIMNGTRENQKDVFGNLVDIVEKCKQNNIKSPSIIIIGDVVSLAKGIKYSEVKPLDNVSIVSTRPYDKSHELIQRLKNKGARVYNYPCIEIKGIDLELLDSHVSSYSSIVFSSTYGVKYLIENMKKNRIDIRNIKGKLFGVGQSIKEQLESYGLYGCIIPDDYNSNNLIDILQNQLSTNDKVLIVSGNTGSKDFSKELDNIQVDYLEVYKTLEGNSDVFEKNVDIIVFTSPSCVRGFVSSTKSLDYKEKVVVCIGESTSKEAQKEGFYKVLIPENATISKIQECILKWRSINV